MAGGDPRGDPRLLRAPRVRGPSPLRTTNALEREHEEIRGRTRVIRIFPNEPSFLRLVIVLAANRSDSWATRRYTVSASPAINVQRVLRRARVA